MKNNKIEILRCIVGSQAHGLASPKSDFDYRGVYVMPTSEILKIGAKIENTNWVEGNEDNTSWEIGHFLNMATHCNPTILETFLAPMVSIKSFEIAVIGNELRSLFPYVWNSTDVMNAFIGYGLNQRKKFFEDKDKRASKYAVAYLRTLYQGWELIKTGTFTIRIADTEIGETLKKWKALSSTEILKNHAGEVISTCLKWEELLRREYSNTPRKETNIEPINKFLLKIRKEFWNA